MEHDCMLLQKKNPAVIAKKKTAIINVLPEFNIVTFITRTTCNSPMSIICL